MIRIAYCLLVILIGLPPAYADIYRCVNSAGAYVTSDRPLPECQDKPTKIYRNDGVYKDSLAGAQTEEERKAAEQEKERKRAAITKETQLNKEKHYLLVHYPTVEAIDIAKKVALARIDAKIMEQNEFIKLTQETLNKTRSAPSPTNHQANATISKDTSSTQLKQNIAAAYETIKRYQIEKEDTTQEFDAIYKRYIEIVR